MKATAIVLAAGEGSRMKSSIPKPLHKVAGYPLIDHVLLTVMRSGFERIKVVIGPNMEQMQSHILAKNPNAIPVIQEKRLGTADAAKIGIGKDKGDFLIMFADTPFIKPATINKMQSLLESARDESALVVLGFVAKNPGQYGRLVVDSHDDLKAIVEFLDCTDDQRDIRLCNSGIMLLNGKYADELLAKVKNNNAKKEYYLTDLIHLAKQQNLSCKYIVIDETEAVAINTRTELVQAEYLIQDQLRNHFIVSGVTLLDSSSVYFSIDTKIEQDVVIEPHVFFGPEVEIASGTEIRSFSYIEGAKIGKNNIIGPFARIRPGTETHQKVRVGNFVEIKNSMIHDNAKINHLSYIGDAYIGKEVNIGAGTITCNFNGYSKSATRILDGAFIGSNVALIAPVVVGKEAMVGAGSVITKDVGDNDLAIARSDQQNFFNKAAYIKRRKSNIKSDKK